MPASKTSGTVTPPSAQHLSDAIEKLVAALKHLPESADRTVWFPRGIDLVRFNLDLTAGRVEVTLSGAPSAGDAASPGVASASAKAFETPPSGASAFSASAFGAKAFETKAFEAKAFETKATATDDLTLGQMVPPRSERDVVGAATSVIKRGTPAFSALVRNSNPDVAFKDEEGTGADRMMTSKLSASIDALAQLVVQEWPGTKLRLTEAWDENMEHGTHSVHYEARAADLTTMPVDGTKLGRLARLAVNAGFDWVFFENALHVHASMSK
jgi:hypothetical protein